MVNQQLVDWIRSEKSKGYTFEQLRNVLIQQNYNLNDISEAIMFVSQATSQNTNSPKLVKPSKSVLPTLIIGIIVLGLIVGGILFFTSQDNESNSNSVPVNENIDVISKVNNSSEKTQEELNIESEPFSCDAFPDKLDSCESFSCEFEHPFTSELMEKEIIGLVNGKCQYTEEMPNGGRMDCDYTENLRKVIAQYYKDLVAAESAVTSIETDIGSEEAQIKYIIDGKEVENPLQEAMTNGQCTISGY